MQSSDELGTDVNEMISGANVGKTSQEEVDALMRQFSQLNTRNKSKHNLARALRAQAKQMQRKHKRKKR